MGNKTKDRWQGWAWTLSLSAHIHCGFCHMEPEKPLWREAQRADEGPGGLLLGW
jgi:hypothetical protein